MNLTYGFTAALSALALMFAGHASAVTVPANVTLAANQELTRQVPAEVESLDPAHVESWIGNTIGLDLFEGLTRIDAAGQVVPGVAQSWTRTAPDTWVFKLRHDARWSDGQPVTAADFVYAWQRVVDPKTGSKYTVLVAVIAGKAPLASLGVRAVDAYTLEVKNEVPAAYFPELAAMATMAPVDRAVIAKFGDAWTRPGNFVSNGAYALADWQPNNRLVMVKNDKYWNAPKVVISKVTYLPIESDETAMRMYEAGQFDYTYSIPSGLYAQIDKQFGHELRNGLQIATYYYSLNNDDPAFRDKRVREALSMVIDRDLLTSKLTQAGELPMYGLIVKGTKSADTFKPDWASWPMAKRVDTARGLLKAAGYSDVKPLTFTLTYNTNDLHKKVALFATSEWRTKLGVNAKLENVEYKVLLKERHDGKVQASRDGWFADYNDAMTFFDLIRCGSAQNDQHYCNPKVDALVQQANRQLDDKQRAALLTQAHELAMNDYPMIPLFQYSAARVAGHVPAAPLITGVDMFVYTLRRTLWAIPTIVAVITVCYLLLHLTPGGPFDTDKRLSVAVMANLNAKYHLDEPLWQQYLDYLWALLHGDLGASFRYADWSVNDLVWKALPVSLGVGGVSIPIALALGVALGTIAAVRRNSMLDHGVMMLGNIGNVVPPFVLGPVLVWSRLAAGRRLGRRRVALPRAADRAAHVHQHGVDRACDARQHDRGAVEQFHSHREGQGPAWTRDRAASCVEAFVDAGGVAARLGMHLVDHRGRGDRIGVRAAGPRTARRQRRDQSRLHARAGSRCADDGDRRAVQSAGRPRLRVARSAYPVLIP